MPERLLNHRRPLPPAEKRWKKGMSGNPRGRPKKQDCLISGLDSATPQRLTTGGTK